MKIGLVLSSTPGYSETFFKNKIKFLAEAGFEVIVFANEDGGAKSDFQNVVGFSTNGTKIKKSLKLLQAVLRLALSPLKSRALFNLNRQSGFSMKQNLASLLASAHILKYKLDWLHFGFATVALGRENLAKAIGAKMAVSIRGFDIAIYPLKSPNCYELLWKRLDKLHYISDDLFKLAVREGFDEKTPHQKITPAIDTNLFRANERGAMNNPVRLLTVARLHWKKGLEYTLEALSLLDRNGVDFVYNIIGSGEDYERLVFAARQLGVSRKVFFQGTKTQAEIKEFYQNSDIYLQYSIQEGFCNAVLEAQAMGLLTIVSDAEGLPENVSDGQTGWVVPKRSPRLLAEKIRSISVLSENERLQRSQSAVSRVRENFNLEKQKAAFIEFYQ